MILHKKNLKFIYVFVLVQVLLSTGLGNDITLTSIPMDLYKSSDNITISWIPTEIEGFLYIANSPGETLTHYTQTVASGTGSLTTTPAEIEYGVGLYYGVIGNPTSGALSLEFQLFVESESGVQMVFPIQGVEIETNTPVFSWNPTLGVPYYHIILSDNPFNLAEDEDGNMTVSGAQAIWQIITSETLVQYGDIDPSGSFENNCPPLIAGIDYNWVVMNNYGNSLLYSSQVVSSPELFTYNTSIQLDSPQQIYPAFSPDDDDPVILDGENIISFQWSDVSGAMTYQVFLSELKLEAGSEVQFPVWDQVTTNTLVDFNASSVLIDSKYTWKIIASDPDGVSSMSDLSYFQYLILQ